MNVPQHFNTHPIPMKKFFTTVLFLSSLLLTKSVSAQVLEGIRQLSIGQANALSVSIEGLSKDQVKEMYLKYLKKTGGKSTDNKIFGEIFTDNGTIKNLSNTTIDIYSQIIQKDNNNVELVVAFNLGGIYLSSIQHADRYNYATAWLQEFTDLLHNRAVEVKLDVEEKELTAKQKEFEVLLKAQAQLESDIAEYEQKIAEARQNLSANKTAQVDIQPLISTIQRRVSDLKAKLRN
jgi:chromosome segregation ATPase